MHGYLMPLVLQLTLSGFRTGSYCLGLIPYKGTRGIGMIPDFINTPAVCDNMLGTPTIEVRTHQFLQSTTQHRMADSSLPLHHAHFHRTVEQDHTQPG